jgi:D-alanyl-D-alanine carboxypeptidase (penicillin-binding protein 5/6)
VRYRAGAGESRINLRPGERMAVADLLRALLLESANDAAVTLAHAAGGSVHGFVGLMNARAQQLRLTGTHYANPIGLDQVGNASTARDLAKLARTLLRRPFLADTVDMPRARLLSGARTRIVVNRNDLVRRFPWVDGVKTGHTGRAGYVLVASGERKGVPLLSVVLGEPSEAARDTDTLRLFNYGFSLYRRTTVLKAGATEARARVAYFDDQARLTPARNLVLTLRRGERVRTFVDAPQELHGHLDAGTRVGTVRVRWGNGRTARIPLVTAADVPSAGPVRKLANWLLRPALLLPAAALAAAYAYRRRRRMVAAEEARRRRRRAAQLE